MSETGAPNLLCNDEVFRVARKTDSLRRMNESKASHKSEQTRKKTIAPPVSKNPTSVWFATETVPLRKTEETLTWKRDYSSTLK